MSDASVPLRWRALYQAPHGSEHLLSSSRWAVGRFVRKAAHPAWRTDNQIGPHPVAAFPSRALVIAQAGLPAAIANPNVAMTYDANKPYTRRLIDPEGDACRYFVLTHARWTEIVAHHDRRYTGGALFRSARAPARPEVRLRFDLLVRELDAGGPIDEDAVEEELISIASALVADAAGLDGRDPEEALGDVTRRRHQDAVTALERLLSERFREPLTLEALAEAVELSAFHAARLFRRHTGQSIHAYRDQLRLRAALPALLDGGRLDELALDLGYASHSHFTDRFRRAFGAPPSAVRARLAGRAGS